MIKVAINGFGRIGRMVFRAGMNDPNIEFVAVNDLTDTRTLAHLLKHDSVHGRLDVDVSYLKDRLIIDGKELLVFAKRDPRELDWKNLNIDVVVESTGFFRTEEKASMHLTAGAKKVLISAPGSGDGIFTVVKGVNEHLYDAKKHNIVSNASCTTNCLAPIVKVLNDNYGVEQGFMTTIHSYTADQKLEDGPHKDLRRARSGGVNIIPTSTGAAIAVTKVIPQLKGKLNGIAMRVPTPDGSVTDFVCKLKGDPSVEELNELFKNVANHHLKGVLEYSDEELVSTDIVGNPHSSIYDSKLTMKLDNGFVKLVSWYDNEWGYSNRVVDVIKMLVR
jgi:glyceraldehyde 3-phosphate dehydrogenase